MKYFALASTLAVILAGCAAPEATPPASTQATQPAPAASPFPDGAFEAIAEGMTVAEVEETLGREGTLDMESAGGGVTTQTYSWSDGAVAISVTFSNGKMAAKAQTKIPQF